MNDNKNKYEIDVMQIVEMLLKRWWIILLAVVVCVGSAFAYTKICVTPTYTSTTTLLVRGGAGLSIYQQILAGQYQSNDYPNILYSRDTLEEVADNLDKAKILNNKYTASQIRGMLSYDIVDNSNIFSIKVTGTDPEDTKLIADEVSRVFKVRAQEISKAEIPDMDVEIARRGAPNSSGMSRNIVIGAALGLIIGVGIVILLGLNNDVIYSDEWLLTRFKDEVPLLASIPDSSASKSKKGYGKYNKYYDYSSNEDDKS